MSGNPDIAALRAFLASGEPVEVTSSPLLAELGCRLIAADTEAGNVTLEFAPPAMFRQGAGVLQGGIVAALLDYGMAFASFLKLEEGQSAVTTMLSTQFMAGAGPGLCAVTGQIDRAGRRVIHASARLVQGERLVAAATSSLTVV